MRLLDIFRKKKDLEFIEKSKNISVVEEQKTMKKYEQIKNAKEEFIIHLKEKDWNIKTTNSKDYTSKELSKRYKNIKLEWLDFLRDYEVLSNKEDNCWIICLRDYDDKNIAFKYNEFELMSLDSAENKEEKDSIKKYWNENIPIIISVKNGYEYYAINLKSGNILHGFEPDFEDSIVVADNVEDFMKKVIINEIEL